jgi:transposase
MLHLKRLQEAVEASPAILPPAVGEIGRMYLDQIAACSEKIAKLERALRLEEARGKVTARLQTMPGIGPVTAMAVEAFAPPMRSFRRGRDFAAWLGLVPRQKSTGGKQILGRTSKMGQRDIRRLFDHRRHGRGARRVQSREDQGGLVARPDAGAQAPAGGGDRSGQQDGPVDLGDAGEGTGLSGSGGGSGLTAGPLPVRRRCEEVPER